STLLLLADPDLALAAGFLLSVVATGALLLLAPAWAEAFETRLPRWAAQALAIPLAAQVAVTPIVVVLSGTISLAAVPANLLAAPAVPVATVFGVIAACVSPVSPQLASLAAHLAGWPCVWIAGVAHRFARIPGGSIGWPHSIVGAALALVAVVVLVAAIHRRRSRRLLTAVVCGVVVAALLVPRTLPTWPGSDWRMIACDVGQGDALLVRGDNSSPPLLVDAGPDPRAVRTCLDRVGVNKLAAVVLSHLHADHVEGLPGVLGHVAVPAVFVNPLDEPALEGRRVRGWAARVGVPVTTLNLGQRITAGSVEADVLGPVRVLRGTESDPNNDSLVLLARAGGLRLLLTGDVEPEGQAELLARGVPQADVLKLPHHGSAHQDDRFLAASGARVAVASAGRGNVYGHPSPKTLATATRDGMRAMRTDNDGGVALAGGAGDPRVLPEKRSDRPALDATGMVRTQERGTPADRGAARPQPFDVVTAPRLASAVVPAVARSAPLPRARSPPSPCRRVPVPPSRRGPPVAGRVWPGRPRCRRAALLR
ncbi:MAG: competence protein ComEC, partial [Frankiaceae bacterium]|nr:competence protein ComEC [Frankiaceae bacterium]